MNADALRSAYEKFFEVAALPDLGEATDGGWNADQVLAHVLSVAGHDGRAGLIGHVRAQAAVLCDIADRLGDEETSVLVPTFLMSGNELLLDQPMPLGDLVNGLAENHLPVHTRQLTDLRP